MNEDLPGQKRPNTLGNSVKQAEDLVHACLFLVTNWTKKPRFSFPVPQ